MKLTFNITTCMGDADFLAYPEKSRRMLEGYHGVELQVINEPSPGFIRPELVLGLHMSCLPCWYAFWEGDEEALLREFGGLEAVEDYYGGGSRQALLDKYRRDLAYADKFGAEYLVFHVGECTVEESFTENYARSDEDICRASAEIINTLFEGKTGGPLLLLENLWQPGLNFLRPEMTRFMMDSVNYPRKGLMLDTGHLMNTNTALKDEREALSYIHSVLDSHGDMCEHIKGIHLNASLSGAYARGVKACPPALPEDYAKRKEAMFLHVFKKDLHRPFTAPGVKELVQRIDPLYLTTELISTGDEDRYEKNRAQLNALGIV